MSVVTAGRGVPALRTRTSARAALAGAATAGVALTVVLFAVTPLGGRVDFAVVAALLGVAAVVAASWRLEGRRVAVNRLATIAMAGAVVIALLPLVLVLGYTVSRGLSRFSVGFLTHSMAGIGPLEAGGGVYHAIVGTLEQVALASAIAVPLGLLVAVYITEYGGTRLAFAVRFFIDVMTGIPSIVAGLFIFAFWVLALHRGFSGFAAALSLAILMLPVAARSAEEMIKLVPASLREASYALGIPKWRTIVSVVLPTAATGITTGVMLAVARVTGETAPLLLTAAGNDYISMNPFEDRQSALPLFVFQQTQSAFNVAVDRAWAGALTLILVVVVLYAGARLLTRRNTLTRR
jgi:phosphate transport system permease protein